VSALDDLLSTSVTPVPSYRQKLQAGNLLSYSTRLTLHSCPRKFFLDKSTAKEVGVAGESNSDFLFGHSVAAGVQQFLSTGSREEALLASFLAWDGSLDATKEKSKKSIWFALAAVEKFVVIAADLLAGWEVAMLPEPAVELSFCLDLENGYYYLGHIDLVLVNKATQQLMVLELKTTSFSTVNEATYANSDQAIGYSIILDAIAHRLNLDSKNYTVLYLVYKTGAQEFEPIPFIKSRTDRAVFLHDLLVDCTIADTYKEQRHYPMRGESCFSFFRPCEYFGVCSMQSMLKTELKIAAQAVEADYSFTLSELVRSERNS